MIEAMKVRSVTFAFVSTVFFAALGATSSSGLATTPSLDPLATQAYSALASGDNAGAIALYSKAIETRSLAPELLANALLNRALAYQQLKQPDLAVDDYSAALNLDAMSAELRATALYNRGLAHHSAKKTSLAIEDFTSALMLNPAFAHAFLSRGNALRESGQYLFALSDFERALKYNHPDPARVYFGEAQTYELLRRPLDARKMLQAAIVANPDYAPAKQKLAELGVADVRAAPDAGNNADQILTGSISAAGGSTLVHKPDLPMGVEPPPELLVEVANDAVNSNSQTEKPIFQKLAKKYVDRLPAASGDQFKVIPTGDKVNPDDETIIAVESVPAIPPVPEKTAAAVPALITGSVKSDPVESVPVANTSGWSVQIASAASEAAAWTTWKNLQKRNKALSTLDPVVVRADLGAKGIFFRVRLEGYDNQNGAQSVCSKLKSKGVSCYVSKAST